MKKFNDFHSDMHYGVVRVRDHIDKYGPAIETLKERPEVKDRDGHMKSMYLRVRGWIKSAAKLDRPYDLQAVACSCRSLLESAVDMALLASDPSNSSGEKMRWWDLSAQFQMAVAYVQFNKEIRTKKGSPDVEAALEFIQRNRTFVEELRSNLWPQWKDRKGNPLHPSRWTGNNDIRPDIQIADRSLFKSLIRENMGKGLLNY